MQPRSSEPTAASGSGQRRGRAGRRHQALRRDGRGRAISASRIPHGSYCCLLGPVGCGKTTILRMIAGHETPTDGDIRIGGQIVVGLPPVERGTAMMFQSYALFPHLSVLDNVAFSLKVRGVGKAERAQHGARAADQGAARAVRRPPAGAALRRPAAARGAGARADHQSARAAARRAAVGARRVSAPAHARRAATRAEASSASPSSTSPTPSSRRSRSPTWWW